MDVNWNGLSCMLIMLISSFTTSLGLKFEHGRYVVLITANSPRGVIAKCTVKSKENVAYSIEKNPHLIIDQNTGKLKLVKWPHRISSKRVPIYKIQAKSRSGKTAKASVLIIPLRRYCGDKYVKSARKQTKKLLKSYRIKSKKITAGFLSSFLRKTPKSAKSISSAQLNIEEVIAKVKEKIAKYFKSLYKNKTKILMCISLKDLFSDKTMKNIESLCQKARKVGKCPKKGGIYRSIDGTCNNRKYRHAGASDRAFIRLLPAKYFDVDGLNDPIGYPDQPNAPDVPSPFEVTRDFIKDEVANSSPSKKLTHVVMQFGQFLDHDLDLAVESEEHEHCSNVRCDGSSSDFEPPCYPILPLKTGNSRCIRVVRSAAVCQKGVKYPTREQINVNTAYIDGSQIYGSDAKLASALRGANGLLVSSKGVDGEMLPWNTKQTELCKDFGGCFLAGDARSNEQQSLASFHSLFLREHNRIARELKLINYHWNGNKIYSETRKILGAVLQKIVYEDYLPMILGHDALSPYNGYNEKVNPGISNAFATGAYRFGHSTIRPEFDILNNNFDPIAPKAINLRYMFFNNTYINNNGINSLLFGLIANASENVDNILSSGITAHLFERKNSPGLNLAALNIQRSRDHGLPGYNEFRKFCKLTDAKSFKDTKKEIKNKRNRKILSRLYNNDPNLVELWVAGLAETPVNGGIVGKTFNCIIANQFERLRDGDRFFWHRIFSPKKLREIQKSSLSRIYCDNLQGIVSIQKNAFEIADECNERISCERIPKMNLRMWKEWNG